MGRSWLRLLALEANRELGEPGRVEFRALAPVFVDDRVEIFGDRNGPDKFTVEARRGRRRGCDVTCRGRSGLTGCLGVGRIPRSYLYVPGDSAEKLAKALSRQADALIVDLEDAVAPERKAEARKTARHWLASIESRGPSTTEIWVRINSGAAGQEDLAAVFCPVLHGICVPKVHGSK